jgi:hypothetical protein
MPGASGQLNAAGEIVVESAALYTILSIVFLPFFSIQLSGDAGSWFTAETFAYVTVFWTYSAVGHCRAAFKLLGTFPLLTNM